MKKVYCSVCGKRLTIQRKVLKGEIFDVVIEHDCVGRPLTSSEDKDSLMSFIESLTSKSINESISEPEPTKPLISMEPSDIKTTAPESILQIIKSMKEKI